MCFGSFPNTVEGAYLFCGKAVGAALPPFPFGTCGILPVHKWVGSGWTVALQNTPPADRIREKSYSLAIQFLLEPKIHYTDRDLCILHRWRDGWKMRIPFFSQLLLFFRYVLCRMIKFRFNQPEQLVFWPGEDEMKSRLFFDS